MMDWNSGIKTLFELDKLTAKLLMVFVLVTAAILFLPNHLLGELGLDGFRAIARAYVGVVFLLTVVLSVVAFGNSILQGTRGVQAKRRRKRQISASMDNLDGAELAVLRGFALQGRNTIKMPINDPIVSALITKGVLEPVGSYGEKNVAGLVWPARIAPLTGLPGIPDLFAALGLNESPTENDRRQVIQSRPHFVHKIEAHEKLMN